MNITEIHVRGVQMKLLTYNRSLELCARMNYETENLDFIDSIEPGSAFYDLGACEGRFSIYAALKGLNVYSFEPDLDNFETLKSNINHNKLNERIKIFNLGVGDSNKEATLQIGQPWAGGHQKVVKHNDIRQDLKFDFVKEQIIQITDLDGFIIKNGLPQPSFIKIDVDGSEIPFMKGAEKSLKTAQKIIFELDKNDKNFGTIVKTLLSYELKNTQEYQVPNEPSLFNIVFSR